MQKTKWMALCMLALPLVTNIKANNTVAVQKASVVINAEPAQAPVNLIEQIFFPHGI